MSGVKMTAVWKQLVVCSVLLIGTGFAWHSRMEIAALWCSASGAPAPPEARQTRPEGTPVIVASTRIVQDDRRFSAIGTGYAFRSITLRAPSNGEIVSLSVTAGREFK